MSLERKYKGKRDLKRQRETALITTEGVKNRKAAEGANREGEMKMKEKTTSASLLCRCNGQF